LKEHGGVKVWLQLFLNSILGEREWSASRPNNFTSVRRIKYGVTIIKYVSNTTNTWLLNDKNRLHVSAYHKPSSGQLFTHLSDILWDPIWLTVIKIQLKDWK
jgi:hypothetical protein